MKVLIVARGYPSDNYKMNGIFEFDQAKALSKAGVEVLYAAIDLRSIRRWRKWGYEQKEIEGVEVFSLNIPCGRLPRKLLNIFRERAFTYVYRKLKKIKGKPDIVHAHFIGNGYTVAKSLSNENLPILLTEHFSGMNKKNISKYLYKIGSFTYNRMDKVICVSESFARKIRKKFNIEVDVIPNMVFLEDFEVKDNSTEEYTFVTTGRLVKDKGMDILIKTFSEVFKNDENVFLKIFGDGPEYNSLKKQIDDLEMNMQIKMMGLVDRSLIFETLQKSDCFVLASKHETFGVAYIEALATGTPVIATKCGGPEDFVTKNNGVLVKVDDSTELKKALKLMKRDSKKKYNKEKIKNATLKRFSSENISLRLIELYKSELLK